MSSAEQVKILLVDDRLSNLEALEATLAGPGYTLVKAGSGAEALGYLLHDTCALILLDVNMPDMDGYETARLIRKSERLRDIPIVFITAQSPDEGLVLAGYESGAIDFLFKPYHPEVLRSKVAALAALHRAKVQLVRQSELLRDHERREHALALAKLELESLKRKEAEERRYRALVDGIAHAAMWILDASSLVCTFVSPSARALLGYDLEAWRSDPAFFTTRLHPEDRERVVAAVRSLAPGDAGVTVEHRILRADGREAWWSTSVRLLRNDDTGAEELRGFSVDVTEAVEGRETLQFLVRAASEISQSLDLRGVAERTAAAAVGYPADFCAVELLRDGRAELVAVAHARPGFDQEVRAAGEHALSTGFGLSGETRIAAAGELFAHAPAPVAATVARLAAGWIAAVPLHGRSGRLGSILLGSRRGRPFEERDLMVADLLARRAALAIENALLYEKARDAVAAREEFLSVASHELRTPLTALMLQARMVETNVASGKIAVAPASRPDLERRLRNAMSQVERLGALVNTLLDLARIRNGRLAIDASPCDLADVVRDVRARFEDVLARDGRTLAVSVEDGLVGHWDRTRLDQLVTNLVANAVKYGGTGPVELRARRAGPRAVVAVADAGPGIAEAEQARIFERFEQGPQRGRSRGGLGLGLYIAQNIARAHGGRISLQSRPGAGSTFTVELPLERADERGALATGSDAA